ALPWLCRLFRCPDGCFVEVSPCPRLREEVCLVLREAVLGEETLTSRAGELRQGSAERLDVLRRDGERWQVGLREVTVVVSELLGALAHGFLRLFAPASRLRGHPATGPQDRCLAGNLELHAAEGGPETVEVLQLHLGAEFRAAARPQAKVGLAAEV